VSEHRPEVADVFRQHGQEFLARWGHNRMVVIGIIAASQLQALNTNREVNTS